MKTPYRQFVVALLFSFALTGGLRAAPADETSSIEGKVERKVERKAKVEIDARPALKRLKLKEGLNIVAPTKNGYKIALKLKKGEIPEWVGISPGGKEIPTEEHDKQMAKKTTCWRCFKDENGDLHCVEIPCPKGTTPWDGGVSAASIM